VEPTASPTRQLGRWRGRLGALAAFFALAMTGMAVAPIAASADPGTGSGTIYWPPPTIQRVPCADLGPIDWRPINDWVYLQAGNVFTIRSATPTFDKAYGRFVENNSDATISGSWTATEARTVSLSLNFSITYITTVNTQNVFSSTVQQSTGFQVTVSRTTQVGVGATTPVPPRRTMLGEYGLQSLDVVFDVRGVFQRRDNPQMCDLSIHITTNQTAHVPTVNEGWRFTLV
jgi:hypothetical protein